MRGTVDPLDLALLKIIQMAFPLNVSLKTAIEGTLAGGMHAVNEDARKRSEKPVRPRQIFV